MTVPGYRDDCSIVLSGSLRCAAYAAEERNELREYVRVNNELMILQSKARLLVQKPRLGAKR